MGLPPVLEVLVVVTQLQHRDSPVEQSEPIESSEGGATDYRESGLVQRPHCGSSNLADRGFTVAGALEKNGSIYCLN